MSSNAALVDSLLMCALRFVDSFCVGVIQSVNIVANKMHITGSNKFDSAFARTLPFFLIPYLHPQPVHFSFDCLFHIILYIDFFPDKNGEQTFII
jgi:hypothetical protein